MFICSLCKYSKNSVNVIESYTSYQLPNVQNQNPYTYTRNVQNPPTNTYTRNVQNPPTNTYTRNVQNPPTNTDIFVSVSYQDILNLVDYLNKSETEKESSSFEEKYKVMFANRNNNIGNNYSNDDIDNRDLEELLNALIGNNNTSWVGKNCNYGSAPPCSISTNTIDSSEIYGRTIPVPEIPFSKCYFIPDDIGSSYPLNNHNITTNHKVYDCISSG